MLGSAYMLEVRGIEATAISSPLIVSHIFTMMRLLALVASILLISGLFVMDSSDSWGVTALLLLLLTKVTLNRLEVLSFSKVWCLMRSPVLILQLMFHIGVNDGNLDDGHVGYEIASVGTVGDGPFVVDSLTLNLLLLLVMEDGHVSQ